MSPKQNFARAPLYNRYLGERVYKIMRHITRITTLGIFFLLFFFNSLNASCNIVVKVANDQNLISNIIAKFDFLDSATKSNRIMYEDLSKYNMRINQAKSNFASFLNHKYSSRFFFDSLALDWENSIVVCQKDICNLCIERKRGGGPAINPLILKINTNSDIARQMTQFKDQVYCDIIFKLNDKKCILIESLKVFYMGGLIYEE